MEQFSKDLKKIIIRSDNEDNNRAYGSLLLFCDFHYKYKKDQSIAEDNDFLKKLYLKYNFGGVQRNKSIELDEFFSSYLTLVENIENFYKLDINHIKIIEANIKAISKNTEKQYKTGLIDFLNYLSLYSKLYKFGLEPYFDIIDKNRLFFTFLLSYDKDLQVNFYECYDDMEEFVREYKVSSLPFIWLIQKLLSSHHICCVKIIMKKFFDKYVYIINLEFIEALTKLMTLGIVEHHAKLYLMFLNKFIAEYGETNVEDVDLNKCKIKESHIEVCPNNTGIRICDNIPEEEKIDILLYCKPTDNKFIFRNNKIF